MDGNYLLVIALEENLPKGASVKGIKALVSLAKLITWCNHHFSYILIG